jgi:hypothetical protein
MYCFNFENKSNILMDDVIWQSVILQIVILPSVILLTTECHSDDFNSIGSHSIKCHSEPHYDVSFCCVSFFHMILIFHSVESHYAHYHFYIGLNTSNDYSMYNITQAVCHSAECCDAKWHGAYIMFFHL